MYIALKAQKVAQLEGLLQEVEQTAKVWLWVCVCHWLID